jgi:hypothetical protein
MSGWVMAGHELKAAIKTRVTSRSIGFRFYDDPPTDAAYPYINQDEIFYVPRDAKNDPGQSATIRFHCWSDQPGEEHVNKMMTQVGNTIGFTNDATTDHLSLTSFNVVGQHFAGGDSIKQRDSRGLQRHGFIDIKFDLQQK